MNKFPFSTVGVIAMTSTVAPTVACGASRGMPTARSEPVAMNTLTPAQRDAGWQVVNGELRRGSGGELQDHEFPVAFRNIRLGVLP